MFLVGEEWGCGAARPFCGGEVALLVSNEGIAKALSTLGASILAIWSSSYGNLWQAVCSCNVEQSCGGDAGFEGQQEGSDDASILCFAQKRHEDWLSLPVVGVRDGAVEWACT